MLLTGVISPRNSHITFLVIITEQGSQFSSFSFISLLFFYILNMVSLLENITILVNFVSVNVFNEFAQVLGIYFIFKGSFFLNG